MRSAQYHRDLALAIYEVGMKNASPAVIRENMSPMTPDVITSERLKSHLQKYRVNRNTSKEDFLAFYDAWMSKALSEAQISSSTATLPPDMLSAGNLSSGALAAFLGFSTMMEDEHQSATVSFGEGTRGRTETGLSACLSTENIVFPRLTEDEKRSSLGMSLCYVMGLFVMIKHQIGEMRWQSASMPRPQLPTSEAPMDTPRPADSIISGEVRWMEEAYGPDFETQESHDSDIVSPLAMRQQQDRQILRMGTEDCTTAAVQPGASTTEVCIPESASSLLQLNEILEVYGLSETPSPALNEFHPDFQVPAAPNLERPFSPHKRLRTSVQHLMRRIIRIDVSGAAAIGMSLKIVQCKHRGNGRGQAEIIYDYYYSSNVVNFLLARPEALKCLWSTQPWGGSGLSFFWLNCSRALIIRVS